MRDEGVIYVAGHPLLNRRCTRLTGCIRLRNDLDCVGWGIVKLYSLTHSLTSMLPCLYGKAFYSRFYKFCENYSSSSIHMLQFSRPLYVTT